MVSLEYLPQLNVKLTVGRVILFVITDIPACPETGIVNSVTVRFMSMVGSTR
ncbi:hypothetical protein Arash_gp86c [Salmonella phage Arash]|nr:hypothetical protein Arash_gp86c [Salmonella phage Arash]